jgi:tetratricopeptide (TPR) repeat protein
MFSMSSSFNSKIKISLLIISGLVLLQVNLWGQEYTQEEYDAYQAVANEANGGKKIDLAVAFLKQYPKSTLRTHVVAEAQTVMSGLYQAKNWQSVIRQGKKIQAVDSENSIVIQMLADAYQQTKNYRQFVAFGERAYKVNPSGNMAYYLAKAYLELGNGAKFFQWGDRAVAKLPDNHEILLELTKQASGSGRNQTAAKYGAQCLKAMGGSEKPATTADADWKKYSDHVYATCYYVVGHNSFEQQKYTQAVTNLENSVKYYKNNENAYYFLGQSYWQTRKTDLAMKNFAKAYILNGRTATAAKQQLENLYKQTHRGSLAGIERVIDRAKAELNR